MNPIQNVPAPLTISGQAAARTETKQGATSFQDVLMQSIREVNSMQQAADQAVEAIAAGDQISAAEVLTAVQKADLAFRLMMQVRNKIVQAYQEVQNIRV